MNKHKKQRQFIHFCHQDIPTTPFIDSLPLTTMTPKRQPTSLQQRGDNPER